MDFRFFGGFRSVKNSRPAQKRVMYPVLAFVEVNQMRQPVQIGDISQSGVQFFSRMPLPTKVPLRLTWRDSKMGDMDSKVEVVRSVKGISNPSFPFCYGSRFIEAQKTEKKINQVVHSVADRELKEKRKLLGDVSFSTIQKAMARGRMFLKDLIRGEESTPGLIQFVDQLKTYEIHSFRSMDETSQWLQKVVTQYFHCCLLMVAMDQTIMHSDMSKLVKEKIKSMDILMKECKNFLEEKESLGKTLAIGDLHESLKRLTYGSEELSNLFLKKSADAHS